MFRNRTEQYQNSVITEFLWTDQFFYSSENPLQLHSETDIPLEILNFLPFLEFGLRNMDIP